MGRYAPLSGFITVIFLIGVLLAYSRSYQEVKESADQRHLEKAVDLATDAAVEEMLLSDDLGLDYADKSKITINPEVALNTFVDSFCISYDLPPTDYNREIIKSSYIKLFIVCTYDGYYKGQIDRIDDEGGRGIVFSPKLPYTYKSDTATYGLTLGLNYAYKFTATSISRVLSPLSTEYTKFMIASTISDDIMYTMDQLYAHGLYTNFYIPSEMTTLGSANSINGPCVLALVDGVDLGRSGRKVQAFSLGGASIVDSRVLVGYERDGVLYYSYHDLYKGAEPILESFESLEQAAESGFKYDHLYMD